MSKPRNKFGLGLVLPESEQQSYRVENNNQFISGSFSINEEGLTVENEEKELLKQNNIKLEELKVLEKLGEGNSSQVFKALHTTKNKYYALKSINIYDKGNRHQIVKELHTLAKHNCPYLISFYGAYFKDGSITIALELMDVGSLSDVLATIDDHCIPEPQLIYFAKQLIAGLVYMKNLHKVHRDIKPSNICLNHEAEAKFTDFGITKQLDNTIDACQSFVGCLEENSKILTANGKSLVVKELSRGMNQLDWPELLTEDGQKQRISHVYYGTSDIMYKIHSTNKQFKEYLVTPDHELCFIWNSQPQLTHQSHSVTIQYFDKNFTSQSITINYFSNENHTFIPTNSSLIVQTKAEAEELAWNIYNTSNSLKLGETVKLRAKIFFSLSESLKNHFIPYNLLQEIKTEIGLINELNSTTEIFQPVLITELKGLYNWVGITVEDSRHNVVLEDGTITGNTAAYMSPERIQGSDYSWPSDIWAIGLVLLESAQGFYPYPLTKIDFERMSNVVYGPTPALNEERKSKYSAEFQEFISLCLIKDPKDRATAEQLLTHKWLSPSGTIKPCTKEEAKAWIKPIAEKIQNRIKSNNNNNS